jgi:hypothetical protein
LDGLDGFLRGGTLAGRVLLGPFDLKREICARVQPLYKPSKPSKPSNAGVVVSYHAPRRVQRLICTPAISNFSLSGDRKLRMVTGMLRHLDARRVMACTPMSTPIAECVLDAVDVPGQFRDQVPRCETGHPLSYAREVADGLCERLESDKQILPRPEDAGLENSPPPPSSLRQTASAAPRWIAFLPPARARLTTNHQIACLTGRSTVVRRVIVSVPLTRPGFQPKAY